MSRSAHGKLQTSQPMPTLAAFSKRRPNSAQPGQKLPSHAIRNLNNPVEREFDKCWGLCAELERHMERKHDCGTGPLTSTSSPEFSTSTNRPVSRQFTRNWGKCKRNPTRQQRKVNPSKPTGGDAGKLSPHGGGAENSKVSKSGKRDKSSRKNGGAKGNDCPKCGMGRENNFPRCGVPVETQCTPDLLVCGRPYGPRPNYRKIWLASCQRPEWEECCSSSSSCSSSEYSGDSSCDEDDEDVIDPSNLRPTGSENLHWTPEQEQVISPFSENPTTPRVQKSSTELEIKINQIQGPGGLQAQEVIISASNGTPIEGEDDSFTEGEGTGNEPDNEKTLEVQSQDQLHPSQKNEEEMNEDQLLSSNKNEENEDGSLKESKNSTDQSKSSNGKSKSPSDKSKSPSNKSKSPNGRLDGASRLQPKKGASKTKTSRPISGSKSGADVSVTNASSSKAGKSSGKSSFSSQQEGSGRSRKLGESPSETKRKSDLRKRDSKGRNKDGGSTKGFQLKNKNCPSMKDVECDLEEFRKLMKLFPKVPQFEPAMVIKKLRDGTLDPDKNRIHQFLSIFPDTKSKCERFCKLVRQQQIQTQERLQKKKKRKGCSCCSNRKRDNLLDNPSSENLKKSSHRSLSNSNNNRSDPSSKSKLRSPSGSQSPSNSRHSLKLDSKSNSNTSLNKLEKKKKFKAKRSSTKKSNIPVNPCTAFWDWDPGNLVFPIFPEVTPPFGLKSYPTPESQQVPIQNWQPEVGLTRNHIQALEQVEQKDDQVYWNLFSCGGGGSAGEVFTTYNYEEVHQARYPLKGGLTNASKSEVALNKTPKNQTMSRKSQSNNELRAARPQSKSRLGLASKMLASASALGYLSPEVPSNPPQMMPPNFGSVNPTSKTQTKKHRDPPQPQGYIRSGGLQPGGPSMTAQPHPLPNPIMFYTPCQQFFDEKVIGRRIMPKKLRRSAAALACPNLPFRANPSPAGLHFEQYRNYPVEPPLYNPSTSHRPNHIPIHQDCDPHKHAFKWGGPTTCSPSIYEQDCHLYENPEYQCRKIDKKFKLKLVKDVAKQVRELQMIDQAKLMEQVVKQYEAGRKQRKCRTHPVNRIQCPSNHDIPILKMKLTC